MKTKTLVLMASIAVLAGACATYTTIDPGRQWVKDISVEPSLSWNQVTRGLPGATQWTQDGQLLNSIIFISGVEDGKPMFTVSKKAEFPIFHANMLPNEVMELTESSLSKGFDATLIETSDLTPMKFASVDGFRFAFRYVPRGDEVERHGIAVGAIKDGKLYMILSEGTSLVYYDKIAPEAEHIFESAMLR